MKIVLGAAILSLFGRRAGISFENPIEYSCEHPVAENFRFSREGEFDFALAGNFEISRDERLRVPPGEDFSARQRGRLRCRCCGLEGMDAEFLRLLAGLQDIFGPLNISSGRRCARHNREVGGVPNSRHLRGQAADILVPRAEQPRFCEAARRVGIRRILPEPNRGYVHLSL